MAIFCTDETLGMVDKYRGFLNEAMHKQVSVIMGESEMMEEKHVDMFENMIDKHYEYVENIHELSYKEKVELLWRDIFACIQVPFNKYQNEDFTFSVDLSEIEREVARLLTPMIFGDLFYYSRQLRDYNELKFEVAKFPKDIVRELELGIYVTPEMEELRQKELAEIEEEEYRQDHEMKCPECGGTAINLAPNGAGILEDCDFYCSCGWEWEEDWDYRSLKLDEAIDPMVIDIVSRYSGDGIDSVRLSSLLADEMKKDMIAKITNLVSMTMDEMAIIAKVTYSDIGKKFTLDFRVEDDDLTYGKIVKLGLQEILSHKIIYQKNIRDSVINSLMYTLVQKNVQVA